MQYGSGRRAPDEGSRHASPAPTGRGARTGAGQPMPRSARLASWRPASQDGLYAGNAARGGSRAGDVPRRAGEGRPTGAARRESASSEGPRDRGGGTRGAGQHGTARHGGAQPGSRPARSGSRSARAPRSDPRRISGRAPGRRGASAPAPASPLRRVGELVLTVLGTIVMIVAAVAGAIGDALGRLLGRRGRRGAFTARPQRSRFARGGHGNRGGSWRGRGYGYGSRRGYGRARGGATLRLRAVLPPACAGALVLTLLSTIFFVPAAGADAATETKLLDLAPLSCGQLSISTPRDQWQQGSMPYLFQTDPAWSSKPYAGGSVALNGCGPTCLTMVYIYITGNTDISPADMCALADAGGYAPTGSTEWKFMSSEPASLGFSSKELNPTSEALTAALQAGNPVICSVRPGDFTATGHFIVLSGIDQNSMVTVHDPNSTLRSAQKWSLDRILKQTNACWSFSA